jgi:hypothetical protein
MRDLPRTLEHIERAVTRNLDAPARPPRADRPRKDAVRVWRADDARPRAATADELAAHRLFEKTTSTTAPPQPSRRGQ